MKAKVYKVELDTVIVIEEDGDKLLQLPLEFFDFIPLAGAHCDIIFDHEENIVKVIDDLAKERHDLKQDDILKSETFNEMSIKLEKLNKLLKYLFLYIIVLTCITLILAFIIIL